MSNSISFTGRLGSDAVLKDVGSYQVLEMSVANNVGFGEKQSTNWFRVNLWGKQGASLAPHMIKGKEVFVSGELCSREYTDKDGASKASLEVRASTIDFVGRIGDNYSGSKDNEGLAQDEKASSLQEGEDMPF